MQNIIGFQYDPKTGRYVGEYEFPNNMDQEEIHMPPNTTLERPPEAQAGEVAFMVEGVWQLHPWVDPASQKPHIENYLMITESFIDILKQQGFWSAEDQRLRDEAVAEDKRKQDEQDALFAARRAELEAAIAAEQAAGGAA